MNMKKVIFLLLLFSFLAGCSKPSLEGNITKAEALEKIAELDKTYYWMERYVSKSIIAPSQKIRYDNWTHKETYIAPAYKSWLICYDGSAYVNGGSHVLVFVNADTGEYITDEISATGIHVQWDPEYYYCPPSDVLPPWAK